MPSAGLRQNDESKSRQSWFPDYMRGMPLDQCVDGGGVRPQQDQVPVDRCAYQGGLRSVPHQQQLHDPAFELRRMPSAGLRQNDESKSRQSRFPDYMRGMPL